MRLARALLLLACAVAGESPAVADPPPPPPKPHAIAVIPGSHLDVGFTAPPSVVTAQRVATLDAAIAAAEKDPAFRWNEECGYVVHAWLEAHGRDPKAVARLKSLVPARIGLGACWVNAHAALFPPKSLSVLFAWHEEAERLLGIRPRCAIVNDVPSVCEALVDAAAEAGVFLFVCGPNLAFSPPLPDSVIGGPWVRRTTRGAGATFLVDPDSYTAAFTRWGIDPATARFFGKEKFGALEGKAVTRAGVDAMANSPLASRSSLGHVIVQHAFDNWGIEAASRLPSFVAEWNASELPKMGVFSLAEFQQVGPPYVPGSVISRLPVPSAPELHGEWDGQWEEVRAQVPHWTARLRAAAKNLGPRETLERKLALATAMDHTGSMGPPWPGLMTEAETVQHNEEWQGIFRAGIGPTEDRRALAMLAGTNELRIEEGTKPPAKFPKGVDAEGLSPAVLRGPHSLSGPWFGNGAPAARAKTGIEGDERSVTLWAKVDRGVIPGDESGIVVLGWDVPLSAKRADVVVVPLDPDGWARRTKRLLGRDPDTWIAPDGIEVKGKDFALTITSSHAFSYRVVDGGGQARIQVMLVRQSRLCEFEGGEKKVLSFEALYPGEPRFLDAELVIATRTP